MALIDWLIFYFSAVITDHAEYPKLTETIGGFLELKQKAKIRTPRIKLVPNKEYCLEFEMFSEGKSNFEIRTSTNTKIWSENNSGTTGWFNVRVPVENEAGNMKFLFAFVGKYGGIDNVTFYKKNCLSLCPEEQFTCHSTKSCIDDYRICDGRSDCIDRSDETDCKNDFMFGQTTGAFGFEIYTTPSVLMDLTSPGQAGFEFELGTTSGPDLVFATETYPATYPPTTMEPIFRESTPALFTTGMFTTMMTTAPSFFTSPQPSTAMFFTTAIPSTPMPSFAPTTGYMTSEPLFTTAYSTANFLQTTPYPMTTNYPPTSGYYTTSGFFPTSGYPPTSGLPFTTGFPSTPFPTMYQTSGAYPFFTDSDLSEYDDNILDFLQTTKNSKKSKDKRKNETTKHSKKEKFTTKSEDGEFTSKLETTKNSKKTKNPTSFDTTSPFSSSEPDFLDILTTSGPDIGFPGFEFTTVAMDLSTTVPYYTMMTSVPYYTTEPWYFTTGAYDGFEFVTTSAPPRTLKAPTTRKTTTTTTRTSFILVG